MNQTELVIFIVITCEVTTDRAFGAFSNELRRHEALWFGGVLQRIIEGGTRGRVLIY